MRLSFHWITTFCVLLLLLHCISSKQDDPQGRSKRFIFSSMKNLWRNNIIPYTIDYTSKVKVPGNMARNYLESAFPLYEQHTCLRFMEWTEDKKEYFKNLTGHNNYLKFQRQKSCYSFIGNQNLKGQSIRCCKLETCIHELGHAFGLGHEQNSPLRSDYVRINWENIKTSYWGSYGKVTPGEYYTGDMYYPQSAMHYGMKAWSSNNKNTMTLYDPMMKKHESAYASTDDSQKYFYLFEQINIAYQCTVNCTKTCHNGGYVVKPYNGACRCVCPLGLNVDDDCYNLVDETSGGVIDLNYNHVLDRIKTVTFISPQFTGLKEPKTCHWLIKSPSESKILLNFPKFNVRQEYGKCIDEVAVRYYMMGLPGVAYCGTVFKETIISHKNLMMVSFTQTPGGLSSFMASVTYVKDSSICYNISNNGHLYNGRVSYTRDSEACVPWTKVTHCRHHTFNMGDSGAHLESNYCRYPGDGTSPWCYTESETCTRNYCDVCQLGVCKDIFPDCAKQINSNPEFCTLDSASNGCRDSCGQCQDYAPLPGINEIRCPKPELPADAALNILQDSYTLGQTVTVRCNTNTDSYRIITCLSDGQWTPLKYVCGTCQNGWKLFGDHCYFLPQVDSKQSKAGAQTACDSSKPGSILVLDNSKEVHSFILEMTKNEKGLHTPVWLGMNHGDGDYFWEDGIDEPPVTQSFWNTGLGKPTSQPCVYIGDDGLWKDTKCSSKIRPARPMCQYKRDETTICADQRDDCESILDTTPDLCNQYPEFVMIQCRLTCGLCGETGAACNDDGLSVNTILDDSTTSVGQLLTYTCTSGYHLLSGDLSRACKPSGELSGTPPKCIENKTFPFPISHVNMREREISVSIGNAVFALNDLHTITRNGYLVRWEFYATYNGNLVLQVWRPTNNRNMFKLVGQTKIIGDSIESRVSTINLTRQERIAVATGDVIGFFSPRGMAGLKFTGCNGDPSVDAVKQYTSKTNRDDIDYYKPNTQYAFIPFKSTVCRIYSLNAYISEN